MAVAALYDIHGNLPALEAVLDEIECLNVQKIVVGGDVLLGPMPNECLDKLLSIKTPIYFILGNCETAVLDAISGTFQNQVPPKIVEQIMWTADQLKPHHQDRITGWLKTITLEIADLGPVLFCHATPKSNTEVFTRLTPESRLRHIFEEVSEPFVVCGHTHMQFDIQRNQIRIFNAGSVGMPFGAPGAYWLLLGNNIELRRTAYDLKKASERIKKSKYPGAVDFAKNHILSPPSEETMLNKLEPSIRQ